MAYVGEMEGVTVSVGVSDAVALGMVVGVVVVDGFNVDVG